MTYLHSIVMVWTSLLLACGIIGSGVYLFNATQHTMPILRLAVWQDSVAIQHNFAVLRVDQDVRHEVHVADRYDMAHSDMFCAHIAATQSYAYAVSIAEKIRDRYGITCAIQEIDSVAGENMVPWYTLVTPAMNEDHCDDILRNVRNNEKISYRKKKKVFV